MCSAPVKTLTIAHLIRRPPPPPPPHNYLCREGGGGGLNKAHIVKKNNAFIIQHSVFLDQETSTKYNFLLKIFGKSFSKPFNIVTGGGRPNFAPPVLNS